jgi:phosphoglycerate dehydrogenase-like enzyme
VNIAVTKPEYKKAEAVFRSAEGMTCIPVPEEENRLAENITSLKAKHAIVGTLNYTGSLYNALPKGGVIARFGVAHDGIDKWKVQEANLYCTNTPDVVSNSVAELTISYLLITSRSIVNMANAMKQGQWLPLIGNELRNKILAVIGCGGIGCRVAQIASFGFHMKVIGYDIRELNVEEMKREYGFHSTVKEFSEAVYKSDYVTLHIPLTESTKYFMDSEKLKMIPRGAWLVNTSRGPVVDERALFETLKSRNIAGAALDVFENEPYQPVDNTHDLRQLDNVILTPHTGTTTTEASRRIAERCLRNIRFAENGEYERMDIVAGPKEIKPDRS